LASANVGLPRHQEGGNAIYFDTHAKYVRYGAGVTTKERMASVAAAFPPAVAVAPWLGKGAPAWTWSEPKKP